MAKKYYLEDNQEFPAIRYIEESSPPPIGFSDITNNAVLIDRHGTKIRDYLFVRDDINNLLFPICNPGMFDSPPVINFSGWGNLSSEEKEIMARYILAPYGLRLTIFSDAEDEKNWFDLLRITQGTEPVNLPFTGRAFIIEKMRRHVANKVRKEEMTMSQTQSFFEDVFELTEWYIRSATPKFKLWMTSQDPYTSNGFNSKSYWFQDLEDELMAIYNGMD